ncbi:MAG: hypothetical protein DI535_14150 [Citrobacter freundii]|nr:MAG: hypothetical protein DI535_14150 [Citrobacter freundii]
MTVIGSGNRLHDREDTHVSCTWFKNDSPEFQDFIIEALELVEEKQGIKD